jgi:cysteine desulfurase
VIYLDNAATTRPCNEAIDAANTVMTKHFGNPSSLHKLGIAAEEELTAARKHIAASLKTNPDSIFFTSGATEANVSLIKGAWKAHGKHKKRVIVSSVEHPSVSEAVKAIEAEGAEVMTIHPDKKGVFDPDDFAEAVNDQTFLCSVMTVNNETGAILPVRKIFDGVKRKNPGCITHTDAVAAHMKLPLSITDLNADAITLSAHKIHGIKGAGALFIKKGVRIAPLLPGGGQEKGFRSGTEAVPAIAAFGAAAAALRTDIKTAFDSRFELSKYLKDRLQTLPFITINSPLDASPYIINFSIRQIRSEIMLHFLESRDIFVSSGSACSKGTKHNILREFGVNEKAADEALRVSLSVLTTKRDLDELIAGIEAGFGSLQKTRG